jgi:hypothetical protein
MALILWIIGKTLGCIVGPKDRVLLLVILIAELLGFISGNYIRKLIKKAFGK